MKILKNNKGLELAIGTVAVIAIVLAVILVVINFFLGGVGEAGGGIKSFTKGTSEEANRTNVSSGIFEAAQSGKCLGSFDCSTVTSRTDCLELERYGKCNGWDSSASACTGSTSEDCGEIPSDLCNDIGGCSWSSA